MLVVQVCLAFRACSLTAVSLNLCSKFSLGGKIKQKLHLGKSGTHTQAPNSSKEHEVSSTLDLCLLGRRVTSFLTSTR